MKLYRRSLLNPALLLSLSSVAFRFDGSGATWLWHAQPGVALALAVGGAICWAWMLVPPRREAGR